MQHFSPSNQLMYEAKLKASEIYGIPPCCFFERWYRNGSALWLESSSGSILMTISFVSFEIVLPEWKVEMDGVEKRQSIPDEWKRHYEGSLFNGDGSAANPADFEWASAQEGWMKR